MDSFKSKIFPQLKKFKKRFSSFSFRLSLGFKRIFSLLDKGQSFYSNIELDKKLVHSLSKSRLPNWRQLRYLGKILSPRELWFIKFFSLVFLVGFSALIFQVYNNKTEEIPADGGEYTEAVIGLPRYVNPLYSMVSDVDSDISSLIFSSLFRRNGNGVMVGDLASSFERSDDALVYDVVLRSGVKWHSGEDLTVDDVVFTFNAIKDPRYNSPLRSQLAKVSVERKSDQELRFVLSEPQTNFLENLSFGIIPASVWSNIAPESTILADLNLKPIGSGPYKFNKLVKDKSGAVRSYQLSRFDDYYGQLPHIQDLTFRLFPNVEEELAALNNSTIQGISYLSRDDSERVLAKNSMNFYRLKQPYFVSLFFNQKNSPLLADKKVREALVLSLNKEEIVSSVFHGEAQLIDSPFLPDNPYFNKDLPKHSFNPEAAKELLTQAGWSQRKISQEDLAEAEKKGDSAKKEEKEEAAVISGMGEGDWLWSKKDKVFLEFDLVIPNIPDSLAVAEKISQYWQAIGVKCNVVPVELDALANQVVKGRDFQVLLYGQMINREADYYSFWHSSQAKDGGLNIASYQNKEVDKILEEIRTSKDESEIKAKYGKFQEILTADLPVAFLYSPTYTYVQSKKIKGFDTNIISSPSGRLANIANWYLKTARKINWGK